MPKQAASAARSRRLFRLLRRRTGPGVYGIVTVLGLVGPGGDAGRRSGRVRGAGEACAEPTAARDAAPAFLGKVK